MSESKYIELAQEKFISRNTCPICENSDISVLLQRPFTDDILWSYLTERYEIEGRKNDFAKHSYTINYCDLCEFYFVMNVPGDSFYEQITNIKNHTGKTPDRELLMGIDHYARLAFEAEKIAVLLGKVPSEVSVMEFGSGFGHWLRMATAFNYKTLGVEIYEDRIAYAESFGLSITRSLDNVGDETKDFIFSNQVFEHLTSPLPILVELVKKLKVGGILEIGVPESGHVKESIKNSLHIPDKLIQPIGHINCFTNTALVKLCEKAGLSLLSSSFIRKQYKKIFMRNRDFRYARAYVLAGYKQNQSCTLYLTKK